MKTFDDGYLEQLALGLEIEESSPGYVTLEEAARRSEVARAALELRTPAGVSKGVIAEGGLRIEEGASLAPLREGGPIWLEDYWRLREAGWPWRVAAFIAWASSPKIGRMPKTQEGLAREVLGLESDHQIWVWRRKNPTIDEVIGLLQAAPLMAHRRDVLDALIDSATNPDYKGHQDRKLYLEMVGDYVPKSKVQVERGEVEDLSDYSDEELAQLSRGLVKGKPLNHEEHEGNEDKKDEEKNEG
jgi:hypothetical protein